MTQEHPNLGEPRVSGFTLRDATASLGSALAMIRSQKEGENLGCGQLPTLAFTPQRKYTDGTLWKRHNQDGPCSLTT
eukprot:8412977-Karenia_brevis.AAC.1